MADWPVRGTTPWDARLKQYVDGGDAETLASVAPEVAAALSDNPEVITQAAEKAAELAQSDQGLSRSSVLENVPADMLRMLFQIEGSPDSMRVGFETIDASVGVRWGIASRNPATGKIHLHYGRMNDGSIYLPGGKVRSPLCIFGDSLTAGWTSYVGPLGISLGRAVLTRGNGGHRSYWIAARQGGQPLRITMPGNVIPASGVVTGVKVEYVPINGGAAVGPFPLASQTLDGVIAGVRGSLNVSGQSGDSTSTFTRLSPGQETPAPPLSSFVTGLDVRDALPIFWAGRNNFKDAGDAAQIVADVRSMLAWTNRRDRALVFGIPPWSGETTGSSGRAPLDAANKLLQDTFPTMYVDAPAFLRSTATMAAVGVTPTATDLQNIADGVTPASLRIEGDAGHFNQKGYDALNLLVEATYAARGWKED